MILAILFALRFLEATNAQTVALDKTPAEINAYEGDYFDGCLTTLLPASFPKDRFQRVCNSDDLDDDEHCRHNMIGYNETRLSNMNWKVLRYRTIHPSTLTSETAHIRPIALTRTHPTRTTQGVRSILHIYDPSAHLGGAWDARISRDGRGKIIV